MYLELFLLKLLKKDGRAKGAEKHQDPQSVMEGKLLLLGGSRWQKVGTS